jgi:hypothetical protein
MQINDSVLWKCVCFGKIGAFVHHLPKMLFPWQFAVIFLSLTTTSCEHKYVLFVQRRKFSVRAFSADLVKYNIRVLQYIGELCRYLCTAPPNAEDDKVRVDFAIGNGMRPDVWDKFQVSTQYVRL